MLFKDKDIDLNQNSNDSIQEKEKNYNLELTVDKIIDEFGREQESAPHPKQKLKVKLSGDISAIKPGMILRVLEK